MYSPRSVGLGTEKTMRPDVSPALILGGTPMTANLLRGSAAAAVVVVAIGVVACARVATVARV